MAHCALLTRELAERELQCKQNTSQAIEALPTTGWAPTSLPSTGTHQWRRRETFHTQATRPRNAPCTAGMAGYRLYRKTCMHKALHSTRYNALQDALSAYCT